MRYRLTFEFDNDLGLIDANEADMEDLACSLCFALLDHPDIAGITQSHFELAPLAEGNSTPELAWRPVETAPRDGTLLRLLVEHEDDGHPLEDSDGPWPTIGFNNHDNDGENSWQLAGWCWEHDHFTEGKGKVVGWLPFADSQTPRRSNP